MTDYTWIGGSGNWSNHWLNDTTGRPSGAPGSADTGIVTGSASISGSGSADFLLIELLANVTLTAALTVGGLSLSGISAQFPSSLALSSGSLHLLGVSTFGPFTTVDMTGGQLTADNTSNLTNYGTVTVNGGTFAPYLYQDFAVTTVNSGGTLDAGYRIEVAGTAGNTALLTADGGTVSDPSALIGLVNQSGSAEVTNGGTWDNTSGLYIGNTGGTGALTITDGLVSVDGGSAGGLGVGDSAAGFVEVLTSGTLDVTGTADLGAGNYGELDVLGGTVSVHGTLLTGFDSGGTGYAGIGLPAGSLFVGGDWLIGCAGSGAAEILGGASADLLGTVTLGVQSGGSGTLTLNGTNTGLNASGIDVGEAGSGALLLQAGALADTGFTEIGVAAGSDGTVTVSGSGTELSAAGLDIGVGGSGQLILQDGGTILTGPVNIGLDSTGSGTLTASGAGSDLTAGQIDVGAAGSGQFSLDTAATVTATGVDVGVSAGGSGTLSVTGPDTLLNAGGALVIGDAGAGMVQVSGGGSLSAASVSLGAQAGGAGTLAVEDASASVSISGGIAVGGAGSGLLQLSSAATVIASAGTIQVGSAGILDVGNGLLTAQSLTIATSGSASLEGGILNLGRLAVSGGRLSGHGAVDADTINNGVITAAGGTLALSGTVGGAGALDIDHAAMDLAAGTGAGQTISFLNGSAVAASDLILDNLAATQGTVLAFAAGDTIVLSNVIADGRAFQSGHLLLTEGSASAGSLAFSGAYVTANFVLAPDGSGTQIIYTACFAEGTRILTPLGEKPVEALRTGDRVTTPDGGTEPVDWVGRRRIDCRSHPHPEAVWPVLVRAGAFGGQVPHRDLFLSPDHAVFADGVLIPVKHLINGRGIVQVPAGQVTYYHVALPRHGLLLAEGLPAESYLDTGDRSEISSDCALISLVPALAAGTRDIAALWEAFGCAPLVVAGPELAAVRERLNEISVEQTLTRPAC